MWVRAKVAPRRLSRQAELFDRTPGRVLRRDAVTTTPRSTSTS